MWGGRTDRQTDGWSEIIKKMYLIRYISNIHTELYQTIHWWVDDIKQIAKPQLLIYFSFLNHQFFNYLPNNWNIMNNKKNSEIANLRRTEFEEREIVYSCVNQSSQLLLMSISLKFHQYPPIHYFVMLLINKDPENRKNESCIQGVKRNTPKCSRLFLVS